MINDLDIVQWDYLLSPEFEMVNSAGKPLTGGYIEVYIHGTRNKYYCASDFNGTLHPFQIPLDSLGSNIVLASPDNAYDVYVYNKYGSLIMSRYNVHCQGTGGGGGSYAGDKLFYGQYTAHNVAETASLSKTKGNINIDSNGYLQLKQGMSYHITVRGAFQVNDVTNTETTLNYIEYSTISPIKVDVDFTKADPQNFELSYDIYDLAEDMAYQVAFEQINGMVTDLVVEVHSLSNLATTATFDYEAGDYISIVDNTISVTGINPEDYSTHSETYESIVTAIQLVTGIVPDDAATHGEVYEATVTAIDFVTGIIPAAQVQSDWTETDNMDPSYIQNKPDLDIYATHDEVNESITTAVNFVTGAIPTPSPELPLVAGDGITITEYEDRVEIAANVTSIDGYATLNDVAESAVTSIQLVTGMIPDVSDFITHDEVNTVSGEIIELTTEIVNNVSGDIIETVNNVSSVLHEEIQNIPEQVQSDWDQTDDTAVDYIKNKPDLDIYATHDEVNTVSSTIIETVNNVSSVLHEEMIEIGQAATSMIPDVSDFATHDDVFESAVTSIQLVTGMIPDVADFTTHTEVYEATVTAIEYVTGAMPETTNLVAGQNIGLFEDGNDLIIAASGTDITDCATHSEVYEATVTAIEYVTGAMPETTNLVAGDNIGIIESGNDLIISASATDLSGCATKEELQDAVELVTGMIPDVSDFTTNNDVHESIVTAIEYVTGIIPDAQVQSNWTETDNTDPSYIQNKPNEYTVVAGDNIGIMIDNNDLVISASGVDLSDYTTFEDVVAMVSGVTGLTEYGQFYASNITGAATMSRTKGTIEVTDDGKIKLKKGSSYHVTIRGRYNQTTAANIYGDISYIEYITGQSIHVNVDKTITEAQYFELSYDLYKLNNDSDYYVFFSMNGGTVNDLFIEIHSLDGIGGSGTGPVTGGTEYDAGWGIQILNNVISVNPSIIPVVTGYATKEELQDGLEVVTGLIPTNYATSEDVQDAVELVTGLIPDISNLATKDELQDNIELVTGLIPTDYASDEELQDAIELVTGMIPAAQIQSDWSQNDNTQVDYIKNKPVEYTVVAGQNIGITIDNNDLVISASGTDLTGYVTDEQLQDAVELVTGLIPIDYVTDEELQDAIELVTGQIPVIQLNSSNMVTAINNYPIYSSGSEGTTYTAGDGIDITNNIISVDNTVALKTDIPVVTGFVTEEQVTALLPAEEEVEFLELTAGNNISIASGIVSVVDMPVVTGFATKDELQDNIELVTGLIPTDYASDEELQDAIELVTGLIPDTSEYVTESYVTGYVDNATQDLVTEAQVTALLPEEEEVEFLELTAGNNISIANGVVSVVNIISAETPSNTGTYVLKCINGVIQWVSES